MLPAAVLSSGLTLVVVNRALADLLGRPPESLKKARPLDFIDPDQREMVCDTLQLLRGGSVQLEVRLQNADGQRALLIANRGGKGRDAPVVVHFVAMRRPDDDRIELLDALEHSASEWRRIFDAVETPIVIVGLEHTVTRINRAARMLAGRQYGEIVGHPLSELPATEPWLSMVDLATEVQERRSPVARQVKDGCGRTLDLLAMLFNADDARDQRVIVIVWDVSALVDLQTRLEQQRTMAAMGALVAGVAHEVRNPLFAISATVDAMEQASGGSPKEYFEVLREEIDRVTRLMRDLLAYGRPAAPVFNAVRVGEVIDSAIRNCSPLASRLQVELKRDIRANPAVIADRERLGRALANLIDNAIQHASVGTTVTVQCATHTRGRTRYTDIRILDRGGGFAVEDLPRLFEPFFARRKGGTGLGLALVQQIVHEHGGEVAAANRGGGGAEVTVSIPLPRN